MATFQRVEVKDYGGIKVGYVGVTYPDMETLVSTSTLIDENAERMALKSYLTDDQLLLQYVTKTLGGHIPESAGKVEGRISYVEYK